MPLIRPDFVRPPSPASGRGDAIKAAGSASSRRAAVTPRQALGRVDYLRYLEAQREPIRLRHVFGRGEVCFAAHELDP